MDNVRIVLIVALAFVGLLLWQKWQEDYAPPLGSPIVEQGQPGTLEPAIPEAMDATANADIPNPLEQPATVIESASAVNEGIESRLVEVKTENLHVWIDRRGGAIVRARLEDYSISLKAPDHKVELLRPDPVDHAAIQSGLVSSVKGQLPSHVAMYQAEQESYVLEPGDSDLTVELTWQGDGVQVVKRYHFAHDSHSVGMEHLVRNTSGDSINATEYRHLLRTPPAETKSMFLPTFTGGAIYSPEQKFEKLEFDELRKAQPGREIIGGWAAMIQHYFLSAIVPPKEEDTQYYWRGSRELPGGVVLGYKSSAQIAAGEQKAFDGTLYIGPKIQEQLSQIAEGLDLSVDYGWVTVIAQPMFWGLEWFHDMVGNWGWAIILLTIVIKLLFFYPSAVSYRSMANMRKLGPRMQALKDRYGDDKQRLQQAMMEMYKKEKINPLGGCLPILLQIPFFMALYWVLLESVELRQAPWILWIEDLAIKDPYFVLPLLMGATMFIQQKLNPAPPDPMQAKIMMMLPVVFTFFFAFFPAGLVLYWFMNNLLSIIQQYYITRQIEQGAKS